MFKRIIKSKENIIFNICIFFAFSYLFLCAQYALGHYTYMEIDSYALPIISFQYRGSFLMNENDLQIAQRDFPNIYNEINSYEDLRSVKLLITPQGEWEAYYFPIYGIFCLPIKMLLQVMNLNQEMTFAYTNALCIALLFVFILKSKCLNKKQKLVSILFLILSPLSWYIQFISAEVLIFSFVGMAILAFWEKKYKTGAVFISIAGMANCTVMVVGIVFIFDYFFDIFFKYKNKHSKFSVETIRNIISNEFFNTLKYASCFLFSLIPFIYKHVTRVSQFTVTSESEVEETVFNRMIAYFTDLNLGFTSFAILFEILGVILLIISIYRRNYRLLVFPLSIIGVVFAFSLMSHINCGMFFCARYVFWSYPIFVIYIVIGLANFERIRNKYIVSGVLILTNLSFLYINQDSANWLAWVNNNAVSTYVLDYVPELYNPLPSIFNCRVNHIDGDWGMPDYVVYEDSCNSEIRKILFRSNVDVKNELNTYICTDKKQYTLYEEFLQKVPDDNKYHYISINKWEDTQYNFSDEYYIDNSNVYLLGSEIICKNNGYNLREYETVGFSTPEDSFTWTNGKIVKINLVIPDENKLCEGIIDIKGVYNAPQRIEIIVNGECVAEDKVNSQGQLKFSFEKTSVNTEIEFRLPDAVSPQEFGQCDERILALGIEKIIIKSYE